MIVVDLINYLRLEGPHNHERIPTASEEDAQPPGDELTNEEGDSKDEGDAPTEMGPIEEGTLRRTLVRRNQWKRRTVRRTLVGRNRWKRMNPRRILVRGNQCGRRARRRILR